jgi:hypothetical protein
VVGVSAILVTLLASRPSDNNEGSDTLSAPLVRIGSTFDAVRMPLQAEQTAVLLIDTRCPQCNESAPFYRDLAQTMEQAQSARLIVLANQSTETVRQWWSSSVGAHAPAAFLEVPPPASIGFAVFPTLLVLDRARRVRVMLVGRLRRYEEAAVLAEALQPRSTSGLTNLLGPAEISLQELSEREKEFGVIELDVTRRDRPNPIRSSRRLLRIPADELKVRGPVELVGEGTPVVLNCADVSPSECLQASYEIGGIGGSRVRLLSPTR